MLKIFVFSFVGAVIFTWLAIKTAKRWNIVDEPSERKIHVKPVPLLGGVAIYLAYILALLLNFQFSWKLKGVVLSATFVMLASLLDDVKKLSAGYRLVVQVLSTILLISFGVYINIIPDRFPFAFPLEALITIVWIVGITNAVNIIDGVDGLASGIIAIISGTFFVIALQTGQWYFAFLNVALCGACLGFLIFNFNPAKIFLGDAGSSFLGYTIASLAVMGEWAQGRPIVALSIPILLLAVPIFDMVYVTVSRFAKKKVRTFNEWLEYTGKDHLHHRLIRIGFSQKQTTLFIYMICVVFALGVLVLKKATTFQAILLLLQSVFVLTIVTILMVVGKKHLDKSRMYEDKLKEINEGRTSEK
ncbi:MAG: MraY family glycosyltransferase [Candidatus Omnitrophota bacterium]